MRTWRGLAAGVAVGAIVWTGTALGQSEPAKCPGTPHKLEGQIVKIDPDQGKVTVRGTDGTTHELQASKETLQDYKAGDRIEGKLRSAPDCK